MDQPAPFDSARVARELSLRPAQVENVVRLLDDGNTVPFVTRYRKEQTGNLDEESIRAIDDRVKVLRQLAARKNTILRSIEAQGKLTDELRAAVEEADTNKRLEDLYLPFRPKKRTLATIARERGLEPLAEAIWNRDPALVDLTEAARAYVDPEKELGAPEQVLDGAGHILAERLSEDAELRARLRDIVWNTGKLVASRADIPENKGLEFRNYFDFSESARKIPPHRVLALNRGEKEGVLRVRLEVDQAVAMQASAAHVAFDESAHADFLSGCLRDALARLLLPSLEREVRRELTEAAERHAVEVFARNLRSLLLQPPVRGKRVLAVDPGFRTGCKLTALDEFGNLLDKGVVYVHGPEKNRAAAKETLAELVSKHELHLVAIGNGTACRETEELVSELIAEKFPELAYVIVNEAGASVYSTSSIGREEFPEFDATLRGTISIGRRLQDPLSELVKIDPQNIGVGLYQHDVNKKLLRESLETVVESCVNFVGVDLNTASVALLQRVSGLNQLTARRLVDWRREHGPFRVRRQIMDVPGVGEAAFTQAAGFLKIPGGDNPLDATWIHPESYPVAEKLLDQLGNGTGALVGKEQDLARKLQEVQADRLAEQLGVGLPTLRDILDALARPDRDPREDLPKPAFKRGVLKLDDLEEGMELKGTVLNVVDFGVFVDIGLKDSGLVHVSQLSTRFIKSPHEIASVGDVVTAWVLGIDAARRRVSLTMIPPGTERSRPQKKKERAVKKRPPRRKPQTARRPPRKPRPQPELPPLSEAAVEGAEPVRSFGELKRLWETRQQANGD